MFICPIYRKPAYKAVLSLKNELSVFLKNVKGFNKIKVLGAGSNTLIRDGGYNGIIIKFGKSLGLDMSTLSGVWDTNIKVRPEEDWKSLKGRAVVDE